MRKREEEERLKKLKKNEDEEFLLLPQVTPDFAVLKAALPKHGHDNFGIYRRERRDSSHPKITDVHANLGR